MPGVDGNFIPRGSIGGGSHAVRLCWGLGIVVNALKPISAKLHVHIANVAVTSQGLEGMAESFIDGSLCGWMIPCLFDKASFLW